MMKEPCIFFGHDVVNSAPNFSEIVPFQEFEIGYIIMHHVIKMWSKNANIQHPSMFFTYAPSLGKKAYIEIFVNQEDYNIHVRCSDDEPNLTEYDDLVLEYEIYSKK